MASQKWSPEITQNLIRLYKSQEVLYKIDLPNYHNKSERQNAMELIKAELERSTRNAYTTEEVKKKLNNLRTQFVQVHQNNERLTANGCTPKRPSWWLYERLAFLLPFCKRHKDEPAARPPDNSTDDVKMENDETYHGDEDKCEYGKLVAIKTEEIDTQHEIQYQDAELLVPCGEQCREEDRSPCQSDRKRPYDRMHNEPVAPSTSTTDYHGQDSPRRTQANQESPKLRVREDLNSTAKRSEPVENVRNNRDSDTDQSLPADLKSFCEFVGYELLSIRNKRTFNNCKWEILRVIKEAQEHE